MSATTKCEVGCSSCGERLVSWHDSHALALEHWDHWNERHVCAEQLFDAEGNEVWVRSRTWVQISNPVRVGTGA